MLGAQPGTLLVGKYRIERQLGSGGMGVVLEATHVALGQTVAVKLLNAEHARSPDVVARFLREARIAATLPSEHIARVSDVGMTETGEPYIVMERLVGRDLDAELHMRGKLPIAEAVDLMLEACEGVAMAHAYNLVHRDLKPANLFLAERPLRPRVLKVLDFGLSKEDTGNHAGLTGSETVFGTPQYMSPEQIQSARNVDARSDQHALGMILYEMIAGQPAFSAPSVTQLIVVIATHPPPHVRVVRPDVPAKLDEALVRAMAKRPADRFPDLAAFAAAIAPFGGSDARTRAELVARALVTPNAHVDPEPSRTSRAPTDEAPTLPRDLPRPAMETHSALTSSTRSLDAHRARNKRTAIIVAASAVVAAIIVVALVFGMGDDEPTVVADSSSSSAVAAAPIVEAAPQKTAAAPTESATPAASASATSAAKTSKTPAGTRPVRQPKDSVKTSVEMFGGKRK
ncbi:MAG: serine/threonine protein kinase [Polyangiaceae bacterium]|nr:serine/threonine protein kinase [Polyangiaceae bacterium]